MTWKPINRPDIAIEGRSIPAGVATDLKANTEYLLATRGMEAGCHYPVGYLDSTFSVISAESDLLNNIEGFNYAIQGTLGLREETAGLTFSTGLYSPLCLPMPISLPIGARFLDVYIQGRPFNHDMTVYGVIMGGGINTTPLDSLVESPGGSNLFRRQWVSSVLASNAFASIPADPTGEIPITKLTIDLTEYFSEPELDSAFTGYQYNQNARQIYLGLLWFGNIAESAARTADVLRYRPDIDPRELTVLDTTTPTENPGPFHYVMRIPDVQYANNLYDSGWFHIVHRSYTKATDTEWANLCTLFPMPSDPALRETIISMVPGNDPVDLYETSIMQIQSITAHTRSA